MENNTCYHHEISTILDKAKSFNTQLENLKQLNLELIQKSESIISFLDKIKKPSQLKCTVCWTRPKKIAFIPCGHSLCESCSARAVNRNRCFTCRQRIDATLRLFF